MINLESGNMIISKDWIEIFTEDSFDAHRLGTNFYNFNEQYQVIEGQYELTVLVEDLDSGDIWKKKNIVEIIPLNGLGEIILYSNSSYSQIANSEFNISNDKLFLSTQYIEDGISGYIVPVGDTKALINKVQDLGCGEILITSIDYEGMQNGFDLKLIEHIHKKTYVPLITSAGRDHQNCYCEIS